MISVSDFVKEKDVVELTQKLVRIPSQYREGMMAEHKEISESLRDTMSNLGMEVEIYEGGDPGYPIVVGRLKGEVGEPSLGLMGHYNTTPAGDRAEWTADPFGGEIIDGKIYGKGAGDMKGGIADAIIATKAVIDSGIKLRGDIVLTWLPGEGAQTHVLPNLVSDRPELIKTDWYAGEGSGYNISTVAGGWIWMEVTIRGREGHPSWAECGKKPKRIVNPISKMIKLLAAMEKVDDYMSYEPHQAPHGVFMPSVNVDVIKAGTVVNVVPDTCNALVDLRMVPSQTVEGVLGELNALIDSVKKEDSEDWDAEIKPFAVQKREPHQQIPSDHIIVKECQKAIRMVVPGKKIRIIHGSDGGRPTLWKLMPFVGFGCRRHGNAHRPDEYSVIEDQVIDTKVFANLMVNVLR
jgi:succinyl-diaminopimelate desuccinylase